MRRILVPVVAGCVLAACAGELLAQGPGGREGPGGPPSGGMRAPGSAAPQREMNLPRDSRPERGARPDVDRSPRGAERNRQMEPSQPGRERQRATERERNRAVGQERSEQRRNAEREQRRNAERERNRVVGQEQSEQRRNAEREQRRSAERERNAERARAAERDRVTREQKRVEDRQQRTQPPGNRGDRQARERAGGGDRVTERREEMRLARERLGPSERQRLHAAFDFRRARVTNARFDRRIGHRIPRHVHLFPVPREVISFFPYYRDYRYVVVDEEICIVDPRTYEIVDVIDQHYYRGGPRQEVAGLSLTTSQMALVRDSVPRDFPQADVRLRLALGAEIPGDVELYEFAPIVLGRVTKLRDYKFLVAEDQIVIVDPRDRSIALVIDIA